MGEQLKRLFDPATITPWDLLFAAVTVLAGWILSNLARRGALSLLSRLPGLAPGTRQLAGRAVKYAIVLLAIGIGLSFLGASLQPLLAMTIIVGVVLVLALRGISTNLAAGVLLQTRQPVHVGDIIESDEFVGIIKELNARSVVITTRDGRRVHIPNAYLLDRPLVNHSAVGRRRCELEVRLAAAPATNLPPGSGSPDTAVDSVDDISRLIVDTVAAVPEVLPEPVATVLVTTVSREQLTLRVRFWHAPTAVPEVTSSVVQAVAGALVDRVALVTVTSVMPAAPLTPPPAV